MATADNNWPSTARTTAAGINPFVSYDNPAGTMRNIKHGLSFIAGVTFALETASGEVTEGLRLCAESMLYALNQEEKIAEAREVTA